MTARPDNKLETRFEEYGALPKPRPVGRLVRFAFGVWLTFFLYQLVRFGPDIFIDLTPPNHWTVWVAAVLGIMVTPYVVNIGFSQNWKHWPRVAVIATALVLVAVDLLAFGTWWAPPLGVFALAWFIYWAGHLGISFLLSSFIATPGCEMRAVPHLWTILTGRKTREHYCPGFLENLDRWERQRRQP
ncbi:MAG: hypothetical protein ACE5FJ_06505 [Gemmatimonadales bacterium]